MNSELPLPKYHQIYLVLREQLREGRFEAGLPGEHALMSEFGVARVTVRRALSLLAEEGLIRREPGRGTRPLLARPDALSPGGGTESPLRQARLSGLLENLVTMGLQTTVRVVSVDILRAPSDVAQALQLPIGTPVQKAERVRSTQEGPLSHMTTWVPSISAARNSSKARS